MRYNKIRDLREDQDLTQKDVATLLGVNRSTYTMWELGDVNFPVDKLVTLAKTYHTNLEYMLDLSFNKREMLYPDHIDAKFIGSQLRLVRLKMKKTQKDFAKILNIQQSSYSYYEDGKIRISVEKLIYLSKLFRISINEFCGGKPADQRNIFFQ